MASKAPLEGVRVLELTRTGGCPYCSMLLADLGAEVIMTEDPPGTREVPRERAHLEALDPESAAVVPDRRNKRSIAINLREPRGQEIVHELARTADVAIEGGRPGAVERLGIHYGALKAINPSIIYCSLTGFGQDGPYSSLVSHEVNCLGLSGVMSMILQPNVRASFPSPILGDYAGGALMAAYSILAALFSRSKTGEGQYIDLAMTDGIVSLATSTFGLTSITGKDPTALKHAATGGMPYYTAYECADGKWLTIGALGRFFKNACEGLGRPDLLELSKRGDVKQIYEELRAVFATKTRDEWVEILKAHDASVFPVYTFSEATKDEQLLHRKMFTEVPGPVTPNLQVGIAPKFSKTPGQMRWAGHPRGADSEAILQELKVPDEQIASLISEGIIYSYTSKASAAAGE